MASTSELRQLWSAYRCNTATYVRVAFPGPQGPDQWNLYVAGPSEALWRQFAAIMRKHNYLFRESTGGTYNCRKIASSGNWSLHAYAIALDLNPSKNPFGTHTTDQPKTFRDELLGITVDGERAFTWGGDWSNPDPMHWQINVSPQTAAKFKYADPGGIGMYTRLALGDEGDQVQYLQITLQAASLMLDEPDIHPGVGDGIYGEKTASAILAARKYVGSGATHGNVLTEHAWEQVVRVHAMGAAKRAGGEQGPPGPKGEQGPVGPPGPKGDPGPAPTSATFTYE